MLGSGRHALLSNFNGVGSQMTATLPVLQIPINIDAGGLLFALAWFLLMPSLLPFGTIWVWRGWKPHVSAWKANFAGVVAGAVCISGVVALWVCLALAWHLVPVYVAIPLFWALFWAGPAILPILASFAAILILRREGRVGDA